MTPAIDRRRQFLLGRADTWDVLTLAQQFYRIAAEFPDRIYIATLDVELTYGEIATMADGFARGLAGSGIRPGENVALMLANYPEMIALRIAVSSVGAVSVPLNYLLRQDEFRYVLGQSDAVALVIMESYSDLDYIGMLDKLAPGWRLGDTPEFPMLRGVFTFAPGSSSLDSLVNAGSDVDPAEVIALRNAASGEDLAEIVYTSGTTGSPKGVMLTHDNILRCAYSSALMRGFDDGHCVYFALPLYHNFGSVEGLWPTTLVGGTVVTQAKFDPESAFELIERYKVVECIMVPTMTVAMVGHPARRTRDISSLRTIMSGGAPAPTWLWEQVRRELGVTEITTAYGQTEVGASTVYTLPDDPLDIVATAVGRVKRGWIAAADGYHGNICEYRTYDPVEGDFLPAGEEGELVVRGPQVMRGYYKKPEETADAFVGEWMRSGDLGLIGDDGYIRLTGRSKELYKTGGELVAPKEVEELLSSLPGISQAFVVGVPDDLWGEAGWAWIVPEDGAELPDRDAIIETCKRQLARFKVPKHVRFIHPADLPMTPTGKVQKFKLVALAQSESED